jgi:hypothetical protein
LAVLFTVVILYFSVFGVGQIIMLQQIVQLSKSGSQNVLMTVKQQITSALIPKM